MSALKVGDKVTIQSPAPKSGLVGAVDEVDARYDFPLYRVSGEGWKGWYVGLELEPVAEEVSAS
jgi:hypothetical protein